MTFKQTIAYGILQQTKVISNATGVPSNDLVRTCLSKHIIDGVVVLGTELDEKVSVKMYEALEEEIHAITGTYSQALANKPTKGRKSGFCYINAYDEWKKTGNEPVIGWEATNCGRFISIVPHAFNQAKDGTYYDTASNYKAKGGDTRPCWVRYSGEEAKNWLTTFAAFYHGDNEIKMENHPKWADVWGGLSVLLHTDDHAYLVRTYGLTADNSDKTNLFYKTIDCRA